MPGKRVLSSDEEEDDPDKFFEELGEAGNNDDDEEEEETPRPKRRKASRRRKAADDSDDDLTQQLPQELQEFRFQYGPDLFEDDEDRERIESLPELQKEEELERRHNEREKAKKLWERRRKMALEKLENEAASRPATKKPSRTRSAAKDKTKRAMDELKASRQRGIARQVEPESDASEPDDDSDYEMPTDTRTRRMRDDDDDVGADYGEMEEEIEDEVDEPAGYDVLQKIVLTRNYLESICFDPRFEELVTGGFVRQSIGSDRRGNQTYLLAQIVGVESGPKYGFGNTISDRYLILQHGKHEKKMEMKRVSNSQPDPKEFMKLKEAIEDAGEAFITKKQVEVQLDFWKQLRDQGHTVDDIRRVVQQKHQLGIGKKNYTKIKSELEARLLRARMQGTDEEIADLEAKLEEVVREQESKARRRAEEQLAIQRINEKNLQVNKMRSMGNRAEAKAIRSEIEKYESMVRRHTRPTIGRKPSQPKEASQASQETAPKEDQSQKGTPFRRIKMTDNKPSKAIADLHDVDLDLDLDLPTSSSKQTPPKASPASRPQQQVSSGSSGQIDLMAYKKKLGLI